MLAHLVLAVSYFYDKSAQLIQKRRGACRLVIINFTVVGDASMWLQCLIGSSLAQFPIRSRLSSGKTAWIDAGLPTLLSIISKLRCQILHSSSNKVCCWVVVAFSFWTLSRHSRRGSMWNKKRRYSPVLSDAFRIRHHQRRSVPVLSQLHSTRHYISHFPYEHVRVMTWVIELIFKKLY